MLLDSKGHFPFMDNFHPNISVVPLPPNTMLLIQPMDQKVISTFKKYYLHHTFHQVVEVNDKSGTMLKHFWKDYNIYKTIDFAWCKVMAVTMMGFGRTFAYSVFTVFMDLRRWTKSPKKSSAT